MCDGSNNIETIASAVKQRFGKKAEPFYERLLKFFEIVESCGFIRWMKPAE